SWVTTRDSQLLLGVTTCKAPTLWNNLGNIHSGRSGDDLLVPISARFPSKHHTLFRPKRRPMNVALRWAGVKAPIGNLGKPRLFSKCQMLSTSSTSENLHDETTGLE
ncbi:hypothetical protein GX48_07271, partial [Paracoccidioides brasiliensis]